MEKYNFMKIPFLQGLVLALVMCVCQAAAGAGRQALESALRAESEPAGFLWLDREVAMLELEAAMERSRSLPMTPQQAMDAARAYVKAHPEEGRQRVCDASCLVLAHARVSVFGNYYFFRSLRNFKFSQARLVGFFVNARSGEVIPYPGAGFSGKEEDSPYRVAISYNEDVEGKILIAPDDPDALSSLGWAYMRGKVVPKSAEKGAAYLRQAADKGDKLAQRDYADCCWHGRGVPVSREEAIRYYRLAVAHEFPDAHAACMLGHCYAQGEGVPQSWVDAVLWYRLAADKAHAEASYRLAECYEKGLGVPVSRERAMKLYKGLIEDHRAADDEDWMTWANKARAALLRMR